MTLSRRHLLAGASLLTTSAILASPSRAQAAWPNRAIRIVVPFTGGGATDVIARVLGERLTHLLGQPVVIDNRPGAGGILGSDMVAKADPDGYTLLMCTIGTASINQFLYSKMPYAAKDLANIALASSLANVVTVPSASPIKTFAELLSRAKATPGELNYGTPGNGTSGHLCGELLKSRAGINLGHVPYRGSATVIPDLLAGRLDLAIDNLPPYLPHIQEGRLRALAVTSKARWFALPDIPTIAELGIADFEAEAWFGLQAPARTPKPITDRLTALVLDILKEPAVLAKLRDTGCEARPMDQEAFTTFIKAEDAKWQAVVKTSGARLN